MDDLRCGIWLAFRCEPRRHDATLDDLFDHPCVSDHIIECVERKRANAALAMTFHAVSLHDTCDLIVVGHIRTRRRLWCSLQCASRGFRCCDERRFSGLNRSESIRQITITRGIDRIAKPVLIVDRPVIDDGLRPIQNNHIRCRQRAAGTGQTAILIMDIKNVPFELPGRQLHLGRLIRCHGIDKHPRDVIA